MKKNFDGALADRVINPRNVYPINGAPCSILTAWRKFSFMAIVVKL